MKISKKLFLTVLACVPLAFTACGGDSEPDAPSEAGQPEQESKQPEPKQQSQSSGDIGDYTFSINDYVLTKDHDGNPAIIVDFDFTNNGEDTTNFMTAAYAKAFQDGVELESALIFNSDVYDAEISMKDIKTGASLNVQKAWVLSSETSPVEVELEELFSFSDEKLEKTFEIVN